MTAKQSDTSPKSTPATSLETLVATGREALSSGDLDAARAAFETAVETYPDDAVTHNNLGAFYMGLGEIEAAEASFAQVVELLPDNPNCRFNLAMSRFRLDRPAEAAADFQLVTDAKPDDAEAFNNLGAAHYQAGDLDAGRTAFEAALQLHPNYPNAVTNLSDLEYTAGRIDKAIGICEAYLEHQQDHSVIRQMLTILDAEAAKNVARAIPCAEAAAAQEDTDPASHRHLGRLPEVRRSLTAEA